MSRFDSLKVKEVRKETPDCVSILFDVPEELKDKFAFKPGQYLTLRTILHNEDVRRSYSICSAPYENQLRVAVKKVDGGAFSSFANDVLRPLDTLEVMKPMGRFTPQFSENGNTYLFFAAGSGITPVISIIKHILHTQPDSEVTLIYGNKGFDHIIFRDELDGLKNMFMSRFSLYHVLSREIQGEALYNGRLDEDKCIEFFNSPVVDVSRFDEFFVCGPETMINSVRNSLAAAGVDEKKVRFELFTTPGLAKNTTENKVPVASTTGSDVSVTIDGVTHRFKLEQDGPPILDAANAVGADLPFACKGGVCCTCRAKLEKGEVRMDLNYSLEKDELNKGFILTCQAHPITDEIVVNFDIV